MSQQEFDQMDEQVMGLVNEAASPDAAAQAEKIAKSLGRTDEPVDEGEGDQQAPEGDGYYRIQKDKLDALWERATQRIRRRAVVTVALCAAVSAALLIVMAEPELLIWLVNAGVVSCAVAAGITIDRRIRDKGCDDEL